MLRPPRPVPASIICLALSSLLTTTPACSRNPPPAEETPTDTEPGVAAVISDEAERHNQRMTAFGGVFDASVKAYEQAYNALPPDLEAFIGSGLLWMLPWAPPPARYQYIENMGPEANPLWEQLMFSFTPDIATVGFFRMPPGQELGNPIGEGPMRTLSVTPGITPRMAKIDQADPLPGDWNTYLKRPDLTPPRRLEVLRRRSTDPAVVLAIHLYDTIDILPDRFTNTMGRLPANFDELLLNNFVTTAQFKAFAAPPDPADQLLAQVRLVLVPSAKGFAKEIIFFEPSDVPIQEAVGLVIDTESTDVPRRSPLLALADPAPLLAAPDAATLITLSIPLTLADLPDAASSLDDQAE